MIRIPYGISNYHTLITDGYHYIDRTKYISLLEGLGERYLFMVRPRRFGKSLFLSTLEYYYGLEHRDKFQELFGRYYIGQHPTPLANAYLVLKLSFTAIPTDNPQTTRHGFLKNVIFGVQSLMAAYPSFFTDEEWQEAGTKKFPSDVVTYLLSLLEKKKIEQKVYVLIDEYDHFANELLAFDFSNFKNIVSKNGFVRKFYETLKEGTLDGTIDRIFITGVTPITLDSMTSGFNIASKLTNDIRLNEMFGFTENEVIEVLKGVEVPEQQIPSTMQELAFWYNGYLFHENAPQKIYNPDMILYFAKQYLAEGQYPKELLDTNIASDYRKIRNLFRMNNQEAQNLDVIRELLVKGSASAQLTREYSFEKTWTTDDLISLLFYQGILTIGGDILGELIFKIPNAVIEQLYFQYLHQVTLEEVQISERQAETTSRVLELARHNNIKPLMKLAQDILSHLATQDRAHFNELTFKAIFASLFYTTHIFKIYSEAEVRKSLTAEGKTSQSEKGRVDLLLLERPPYQLPHQFVFELKYLKKSAVKNWQTIKKEAVSQLKNYLEQDPQLGEIANLRAYVLLFSAKKSEAVRVDKD